VRARSPLTGATVVNASPAVADELQIDVASDGVVVADLEETSVAARVGFQKGDQILAVNGQRISATKDLDRLLRGGANYWEITISRAGRTFTTVLPG
jgi:S1-C subfamily serine protease